MMSSNPRDLDFFQEEMDMLIIEDDCMKMVIQYYLCVRAHEVEGSNSHFFHPKVRTDHDDHLFLAI
jgi:hypothetical protein